MHALNPSPAAGTLHFPAQRDIRHCMPRPEDRAQDFLLPCSGCGYKPSQQYTFEPKFHFKFSLHMEMITITEMDSWIRIIMGVVVRPIPQECLDLKESDLMEASVWWKCKKWALKTVARVFER